MWRRRHRRGALAALAAAALAGSPGAAQEPARLRPEILPRATFLEDRPTLADPSASYTLYLPASYNPEAVQPVLLIFDPRSRARLAAELFREAADRYGWVLVSSHDTRSDTSWEPNQKALAALWPELGRFAVDPRRVYATGFSGGAMVAWVLGLRTGAVAGIIGVGGRLDPSLQSAEPPFAYWGAAGAWDFNYQEMREIDELVARAGQPHWLEIFPGPHTWLSPELATQAAGWMELVAMRRGTRPRAPQLIEEEWRRLMAGGRASEEAGELLAAYERYRQIEESFAGLRDVSPAAAAAQRLTADPELERQRKLRRRWDASAERFAREKLPLLFRAGEPGERPAADVLMRELGIARLERTAAGEGYPAVAARRMLHQVFTQASFYLPRQWLAAGDYRAARTVLEIAVAIQDDVPHVWYNLACAAARAGDAGRALEALELAVEHGFRDAELLRSDEDLASLRGRDELRRLLERLEAQQPGARP